MGFDPLAQDQPPPKEIQKKPGIKIERSCQDCFFLILFIVFWAGMIVIAVKAGKIGNPDRLIYGTDYRGNLCGRNNLLDSSIPANKSLDLSDKPYLYYMFTPPLLNQYYKICVKECPSRTHWNPDSADQLICTYNTTQSMANLWPSGTCAGTYNSKEVLNRCFPVVVENVTQMIAEIVADDTDMGRVKDISNDILTDVVKAWKYILISAAIAFGLGLVWIFLLRWFAGVFIWLTIVFVMAALVVTSYIAYTQSEELQQTYDSLPPEQRLTSQENNIKALRYICYILAAAGAIILLMIIFLLGRINVAIGIVKETSKAVGSMTSIFLFPILIFVLLVGLAAYWLGVAALLGTAGTPAYENDIYVGYEHDKDLRYTQLYHLFGGFWTMNFILALGQCTIAGSIAAWYWKHDKKDVPRMPVWTAFWRCIRYHLGSLAFGSLILAIVQIIRVLLEYLEKQFKGKEQRLARFFIRCLQCIFAYFERFIKFLNKNAYIMIAIYGYSFCSGARRGFELIAKNFIRVAALNFVSKFLMFVGKLFICLVTCFIAFLMLKADGTITFYVLPVILIGIMSYAIANAFMSVYEMAIDTMLLCFCEDCERNDGSAERPYFMSNSLKHYMDTWRDMCCCCVVGDDSEGEKTSATVAART